MHFEFEVKPRFRRNHRKEDIMNDQNSVNVNDKIDETKSSIAQAIADHPELVALGAAAIFYIGYQHGRNRALMDTMRLAAMDRC